MFTLQQKFKWHHTHSHTPTQWAMSTEPFYFHIHIHVHVPVLFASFFFFFFVLFFVFCSKKRLSPHFMVASFMYLYECVCVCVRLSNIVAMLANLARGWIMPIKRPTHLATFYCYTTRRVLRYESLSQIQVHSRWPGNINVSKGNKHLLIKVKAELSKGLCNKFVEIKLLLITVVY